VVRVVDYDNPGKFFFKGLLLRAVIGGTLGLLYAPKKGSETRKFIKDKADMMQDKVMDIRGKMHDIAEDVTGKAA
jgi:gas vesicle protein